MTYQSNPQHSGFRELSERELSAVSGGFLYEDNIPDVIQDQFPSLASTLGIYSWGADGDSGGQSALYGSDADGHFIIVFGAASDNSGGHSERQASSDDEANSFGCNVLGGVAGVIIGVVALPGATLVTGGPIGGAILSGTLGVVFAETVTEICTG